MNGEEKVWEGGEEEKALDLEWTELGPPDQLCYLVLSTIVPLAWYRKKSQTWMRR